MKKRKAFKRVLAVTLSAAMVAGSGISALAADYNYEPPTSPMEVDDNIITASVHRAGSVLPEILGMNTCCGFSMINGTMPTTLEEAKTKLMLGVFGTDANDSPDPYYYNYFYNFYAEENDLELSEDAVIIPENNVAASPAKADTTIINEYGTSISLAGRPDVLIGVSSTNSADDLDGYDELIQAIRDGLGEDYYQEGDEDYSPYLVSYTTTTTYDMIMALNETANVMNVITAKTGKTGRYGDPLAIAEQFGDYVCGVSTYVLSELENQNLEKKTVAVVQNINSDGTFTIADAASQDATSTVRGVEYVALVSNNIAGEDYLNKTTGVSGEELLTADVVIISGSNGGGNDDTALPNTEEGLIEALEVSGYDETDLEDKMVITGNPDSIYGITMNSIENGMGFGYFVGYMYSDILDIDPVEMCTYFYEQFYHVSDFDSLQSVTATTFSDVDLPEGMSTDISDYNTAEIDAKLAQGKEYYYDNFEDFADTALTKVWPEDQSGIAAGSSKNYTAADSEDVDLTELETEVDLADDIVAQSDCYEAESYETYASALTNGYTVLNNSSYFDQDEVDTITDALTAARQALEELDADYTAVTEAIAKAAALNEDDYVDFNAVTAALDAVVTGKGATEQDEVDAMADAINEAIEALVLNAADYTALDAAIAIAEALDSSNYASGMDKVNEALAAAKAADRELPVTDQSTIDELADALNEAIGALVLSGADYTAVTAAIAAANALDADNYEDFSAVTAAVNAVVNGLDITYQDEVDAMATAITNAIAALTLKDADYTAVEEAIEKAEGLNEYSYKDFSAVTAAISAVEYGLDITYQDEVDAMADAINDAIDSLAAISADTLAVRRDNIYYFSYSLKSGDADKVVAYGTSADEVLIGDWDGDGVDTLCVRRGNVYYISNSLKSGDADQVISFGKSTDEVLVGDWDGDGVDTLCVRRGNVYYISNSIKSGDADQVIAYGKATDTVLVGKWAGNDAGTKAVKDTLCVRRDNKYYFSYSLKAGDADKVVAYGKVSDSVLIGDWDADGYDTLTVRRGNVYYISNAVKSGDADQVIAYGKATDDVYAGAWK